MTEKDRLRRIVTSGSATTGFCVVCHKEFFTDELRFLPEVESYTRELSLSIMRCGEHPTPPSDSALQAKYGFGFKAMFCDKCYKSIV